VTRRERSTESAVAAIAIRLTVNPAAPTRDASATVWPVPLGAMQSTATNASTTAVMAGHAITQTTPSTRSRRWSRVRIIDSFPHSE
jgi:hypothetical protein